MLEVRPHKHHAIGLSEPSGIYVYSIVANFMNPAPPMKRIDSVL